MKRFSKVQFVSAAMNQKKGGRIVSSGTLEIQLWEPKWRLPMELRLAKARIARTTARSWTPEDRLGHPQTHQSNRKHIWTCREKILAGLIRVLEIGSSTLSTLTVSVLSVDWKWTGLIAKWPRVGPPLYPLAECASKSRNPARDLPRTSGALRLQSWAEYT